MKFKKLKIERNKKDVDKVRLEKMFIENSCDTCSYRNCSEKVSIGGVAHFREGGGSCKNWRILKEIKRVKKKYYEGR